MLVYHNTFFVISFWVKHFQTVKNILSNYSSPHGSTSSFKGILKWPEPCKCFILFVSRILRHKRINLPFKKLRICYLILTGHVPPLFLLSSLCSAIPAKTTYLYTRKTLWCRVLGANKKQVLLESYSLEIKIDSVNEILKNKRKVE